MSLSTKIFLPLILFIVSCSPDSKDSSGNRDAKPLNPNGDSELAILMREMVDEAERIRSQIKNDEPVTLAVDHEAILTAHATEPEKAASAEYQAFADAYLRTINALEKAPPTMAASLYNDMIENCTNCHQVLCPGPIMRISKLR